MDHRVQVQIMGAMNVGKSSIVHRYCDKQFSASYDSTEGLDVYPIYFLHNTENVKMDLLDFSGTDKNRKALRNSYKKANGIFLVFDVTRRSTYEFVLELHQEILKTCGNRCPTIILIGNKVDLPGAFPNQDTKRYALEHKLNYIETSAFNGSNITHAFDEMIESLMLQKYVQDHEESVKSQLKSYESIMTPIWCRCCPESIRPSIPGTTRPRRVVIYRRKTFEGRDIVQPQEQKMRRASSSSSDTSYYGFHSKS